MNLSTFIHSEKDRHGLRSMKIEPVALFLHDEYAGYTQMGEWDEQMGGLLGLSKEEWYADAVPLYTEAQMRQLVEACAARCERTPKMQAYGNNRAVQDECAAAIRKLIKELLS